MKRIVLVITILIVTIGLFNGCGPNNNGGSVKKGEQITIKVDWNNMTPSVNSEPTQEAPTVFVSPQKISDEFTKLNPNIKIEWYRTKGPMTNWDAYGEWFTTAMAAGTAPDIIFAWGDVWASSGWYVDLTEEFKKPNEYVKGNKAWKDLYPDYIWNSNMNVDVNGRVIAVPFTMYPGPSTGYYYNKDLFKTLNLTVPKTWEAFLDVAGKVNSAGKIAIAPFGQVGSKTVNVGAWDIQFSLGPLYAMKMMDKLDINKDGSVSSLESIKAGYEGLFFTQNNANARDIWAQLKLKYSKYLKTGYENTDYEPDWLAGNVGMLEDGLWRLPVENSNTLRKFEYGLFPAPIITKESSQYVSDVEYTEKGPYRPDPLESMNIIDPAKQNRNPAIKDACIKFMKFATTPENQSAMIVEKNGSCISAVKGTSIPKSLDGWFSNSFPKIAQAKWPSGYTPSGFTNQSRILQQWISGKLQDDQFYKKYDEALKKDIDDYIVKNKINKSAWKEYKPA